MKGVIIGGGVIGLSVAWEMARAGIACTVIDQEKIGRGCSWAGAGILPPARLDTALDPIDQLRGLSHQLYPAWTLNLQELTGIDTGFRQCGGIYLARSPGESASLIGQAQYWAEYGIVAEQLTSGRLTELEPAICQNGLAGRVDSDTLNAWYLPDECQVRPPRLLRALRRACESQCVEMIEETRVHTLTRERSQHPARIVGIESDAGPIEADIIVLCCGAWASRFADPIGQLPNVFPVRGQVVQYQLKPGMLRRIINEGNRYLMPREDGCLYVGSNEEEVGLSVGTTTDVIHGLCQWAETIVPELKQSIPEKTWSGLRPGSMDGFPFLGRSPRWENLYFASGHFRSGLHLACGTAQVLVESMLNQSPSISIEPFSVNR